MTLFSQFILKVARTIADLAGNDGNKPPHVLEAIHIGRLTGVLRH